MERIRCIDPFADIWRCTNCGAYRDRLDPSSKWRWADNQWNHQCIRLFVISPSVVVDAVKELKDLNSRFNDAFTELEQVKRIADKAHKYDLLTIEEQKERIAQLQQELDGIYNAEPLGLGDAARAAQECKKHYLGCPCREGEYTLQECNYTDQSCLVAEQEKKIKALEEFKSNVWKFAMERHCYYDLESYLAPKDLGNTNIQVYLAPKEAKSS